MKNNFKAFALFVLINSIGNVVGYSNPNHLKLNTHTVSNDTIAPSESKQFEKAIAASQLQSTYMDKYSSKLEGFVTQYFYVLDNKLVLFNDQGEKTRTELRKKDNFDKMSSQKMHVQAYLVEAPEEVTVAQLHNKNSKSPLLRIIVKEGKIAYRFNNEPIKGTKDTDNGYFKNKLPNGKSLDIMIEVAGAKVTATVNGETKTFIIDERWGAEYDNMYYFKTGVYCQSEGPAQIEYVKIDW